MIVTEQTFDVGPADLFGVISDPYTYPEWLVGTKQIREVSADWPDPGSFFRHTVGFGPVAIPDRTDSREVVIPCVLELLVRARPAIEAVVRFEITIRDGGSRLRMTETPVGPFKFLAPLAQPLIRARNERSLRRLKSFVEAQTTKGSVA